LSDSELESVTEEMQTEDSGESELDLSQHVANTRMQCMAHTLQLTIQIVYKQFAPILAKTGSLVSRIRKSAKMMEKITKETGKSVITDNTTRWNSTHMMISRLLDIKGPVNNVLNEHGVDSLTVSEWTTLDVIRRLLEPFATQTYLMPTHSRTPYQRFWTCIVTCSSLRLTKPLQSHWSKTYGADLVPFLIRLIVISIHFLLLHVC